MKNVCATIGRNGTALLVGTVGVDFHAGQNVDLAAAYGGLADGAEPRREDLPRFAWFPAAGGGAWVPYPGRPELEPLRSWVPAASRQLFTGQRPIGFPVSPVNSLTSNRHLPVNYS